MEEKDFNEPVRLFQSNGYLIGYLTAFRAVEMINSGKYKIINRRAIEEVSE